MWRLFDYYVRTVQPSQAGKKLYSEAENETQKCSMFYIFNGSVQLKSLGQTNLLVRRREFSPSLLQSINCSNFARQTRRKQFDWSDNKPFTVNIPRTNILVTSHSRSNDLTSKQLARPERNLERIIHGRADIIFILSLSLVEAYKESRQKRLAVKHRAVSYTHLTLPTICSV